MRIYTEVRKNGRETPETCAVHETVASASAWLSFKLVEGRDLTGRFYGHHLSATDVEAICRVGRIERLP